MTKKHIKSKNLENHKKPTHKNLLKEEFGQELGDMNAAQIYGVLEGNKNKGNKEGKNRK
ncbi:MULTISPECIES: hypothetical protein [Metabacillus]|jgi:hypothetical protein|uniref:Uncharacterized protein n=1 Tax=Metabacillus rhizolycopersici TaxID=2875709 RepID=A0ABS7UUJ8_9BACI|nr:MULTISPECIES: hypothetical protein [Metabacillus]MBZ5751737.1 hypothetical protein [Metabacillus rhizolycopersici]MCM3652359.1 hypothetical protein [Metabacillus litoralis]